MFVRRALLSVSDKTDVVDFARALHDNGVSLIATAGTAAALLAADIPVTPVAELTGYQDAFLGGRVKTLQPELYAALLADRENPQHLRDLEQQDIELVDLLCLNLYPFGGTDQDELRSSTAITHIDIGGPMLLRAAALNHPHVAVVTRSSQYGEVVDALDRNRNALPETLLARLSTQAFALVASYEAQASAWFAEYLDRSSTVDLLGSQRVDWTPCHTCSGAVASSRVDFCLRHLDPADRRRELQELDGELDLRSVKVAPSLLSEILSSAARGDGRPRLRQLRCEWTQFEGAVSLESAIVTGDADFSGARFSGDLNFSGVLVKGELRCRDTHFRSAVFNEMRVDGLATFRSADFTRASFSEALFGSRAVFETANFAGDATFERATFRGDYSFIGAAFDGRAIFEGFQWLSDSRFRDATFTVSPTSGDLWRFSEATVESQAKTAVQAALPSTDPRLPSIFIGSSSESVDIARALQQNLDHDAVAVIWPQGGFDAGGIASHTLSSALRSVDFAAFVVADDDIITTRGRDVPAPRDNVIYESGLAAGILGEERTFLVVPRGRAVKVPSDLAGKNVCTYDPSRSDVTQATGAASTEILKAMRVQGLREHR